MLHHHFVLISLTRFASQNAPISHPPSEPGVAMDHSPEAQA